MKSFLHSLLLFFFISFGLNVNAQPDIDEQNTNRGLYIDNFVYYSPNTANFDPVHSILGVDEDLDGVFEKERAVLEYCRDHHITSLVILGLQ